MLLNMSSRSWDPAILIVLHSLTTLNEAWLFLHGGSSSARGSDRRRGEVNWYSWQLPRVPQTAGMRAWPSGKRMPSAHDKQSQRHVAAGVSSNAAALPLRRYYQKCSTAARCCAFSKIDLRCYLEQAGCRVARSRCSAPMSCKTASFSLPES